MNVAFYAPMKDPDNAVPSGDRAMGRLFLSALAKAGFAVEVAARFRSYDKGDPVRQARLSVLGKKLADRTLQHFQMRPRAERPDIWFTYHLYYKAPDWLGPIIADRLSIPYVVAEAACSPSQADGKWSIGYHAVANALSRADLVLGLNPKDKDTVLPHLQDPGRYNDLLPFIDASPFFRASSERQIHRLTWSRSIGIDPSVPWLCTVAMMREDQKLESYQILAEALVQVTDLPWQLLVVGDGPARTIVERAFEPVGDRVFWFGQRQSDDLQSIYAASDLSVWPAVREAFGMVPIEAAASRLPVVAGEGAGIAQSIKTGVNGILTPQQNSAALAQAVRQLLVDTHLRQQMGAAGQALVAKHQDISSAAEKLRSLIRPFMADTAQAETTE